MEVCHPAPTFTIAALVHYWKLFILLILVSYQHGILFLAKVIITHRLIPFSVHKEIFCSFMHGTSSLYDFFFWSCTRSQCKHRHSRDKLGDNKKNTERLRKEEFYCTANITKTRETCLFATGYVVEQVNTSRKA